MAIITLSKVSIRFGGQPLLDGVDFLLQPGDRACLVGRNGEGKSTLLRLVAGELEPDGGSLTIAPNVTVSHLPQAVPDALEGPVRDLVQGGLRNAAHGAGWSGPQHVERALSLLGLDGDAPFESLSGGMKRRALLARAIAPDPDVLLLDEPTNHLDVDSIEWLEGFLKRYGRTLLFVTHDRMFLRRLATRIVDLDRGRLCDWECDYDTFLRRKQDLLDDEVARNARFDKKLSKEEVWIRQGIKARRTRDEGRVRALKEMRTLRQARRATVGTAAIRAQEAEASGELVSRIDRVTFGYGDGPPVIRDLSTVIMRGDKVGIIGPNGCGKTTLLRLLLGPHAASREEREAPAERPALIDHRASRFSLSDRAPAGLQPRTGSIRRGTRLQVAYFDQQRAELDDAATVFENIAHGSDTITIDGKPRNVYGYLQEFLFTPDRARQPISVLSGGERNRLLLARLFARPANLLVMDEPTNDLDAPTLELLEERLVAFGGTILLVSHDREFLNHVVTSTLVFEGDGRVAEYVGGYDDWVRQRPRAVPAAVPAAPPAAPARPTPRRLSYKETRELAELPQRIETLESEQAALHADMADPAFYRRGGEAVAAGRARLKEIEDALADAYARWSELDSVKNR